MYTTAKRRAFCPRCRRDVPVEAREAGSRPTEALRRRVRVVSFECVRCACLVAADTAGTLNA